MSDRSADVVIAGAGIGGVAVAHQLAVRDGITNVVLCDPRPPLTLTSDKSTECYRNLWPNAPMVELMNRSIDILEDVASENDIGLNRRGYLYVTADREQLGSLRAAAERAERLGSGPLRIHDGSAQQAYEPADPHGWDNALTGTDLITDTALLHRRFPGLSNSVVGALHVRRAGWCSAQQLGAHMLDRSKDAGLTFLPNAVSAVDVRDRRVQTVELDDGTTISCGAFVNAAGPMLGPVAGLLGESLPIHSEVHHKVAFKDPLGVIPREAPLMIWNDPQHIDWSDEERSLLRDEGRADLVDELPLSCHGRPEGAAGSPWVLALWEYHRTIIEPEWPMPEDPLYGEVVVRGLAAMYPGLHEYADRMPQLVVDGGYYTKTVENRPLAGPMRTAGAFVAGALSGFGIMAACGVADLVGAYIAGRSLPAHAPAFALSRYDDPEYVRSLEGISETGQL
jgi:glycine/D-amino acid oxidase-like deaminating enzyme